MMNSIIDKLESLPAEIKKTEQGKESSDKYQNQLCCYNGEILTLRSLFMRFRRARMPNPDIEAKKYLIKKESKTPIEFYDVYP